MLVEFSVENYLSFKERATLSMVATTRKELVEEATFEAGVLRLLKSATIYGANASGKSNLFKAMEFMRRFVLKSAELRTEIDVTPFLFSTETENEPSSFEMVFIRGGIQYRYGFSVDRQKVHREWFFYIPKKIETVLFNREGDKIAESNSKFPEAKELISKTRPDTLLLTIAAQFNSKIALEIVNWFTNFIPVSGMRDNYHYTFDLIEKHPECLDKVRQIIKAGDIGIEDLVIRKSEVPKEETPEQVRMLIESFKKPVNKFFKIEVDALHQKYDANSKPTDLRKIEFAKYESDGTKKLLSLLGPILDALLNGKVLFIDEMEVGLHPHLSELLVKMFNAVEYNSKHAQVILTTHNTHLLNINLFRRDQIWFTAKDRFGGSKLNSLSDFRKRKDASLEKDYLQGLFGAIPIIQEDLLKELECNS
ncbi:MAG: ATP-binding protein [archaeon]